jgi:hypothetical protein
MDYALKKTVGELLLNCFIFFKDIFHNYLSVVVAAVYVLPSPHCLHFEVRAIDEALCSLQYKSQHGNETMQKTSNLNYLPLSGQVSL